MGSDASEGVWTAHLDAPGVRSALAGARVVRASHAVATVGSTQDVALDLAVGGAPSGTLVVADLQTAGRGRSGRTWDDHPDGRTLAMTLLLDTGDVATIPLLPHALGLAVVAACEAAAPVGPSLRLKWPNDVVHRPEGAAARKLAGVLVERDEVRTSTGRRDVLRCGIGIDVDLRGVDDAADRTSLAALAGREPDRAVLLEALVSALDAHLALLAEPERLLERYRGMSDTIGRPIRIEPPEGLAFDGVAHTVDEQGRLVVRTDAGERAILSATVRDAADAL